MIRPFESKDLEGILDIWLEANLQAHDVIASNYWLRKFKFSADVLPQTELSVCEDGTTSIASFIGLDGQYI
ncbi:hypothetical protein ACVRWB_04485 [Streptococcus troglodytae]|uniref:Acetyltransferase n=1 Tax=Streptococcus troglodytae TaxID=1111760 RepID=A0A1L7LJZ4_9STRE|nr:hypothetical protein [Streptococcus troglodytae]BAQ24479.1 putative uncharacterized protein [Streptococcus troglodytae]